jgi:hypothetical protein
MWILKAVAHLQAFTAMSDTMAIDPSFGTPRDEDGTARPAPRRTYGKRAVTPPEDDEPRRSIFTTIASESPSKTLLNRWSDKGKDWRASLADLGSDASSDLPSSDPPIPEPSRSRSKLTDFGKATLASEDSEDGDDEEVDEEELKKQMETMRRQARGLDVTANESQEKSVGSSRQDRIVAESRKLAPFSSTLTPLPTSDVSVTERSSPPIASERESSNERSSTAEIIPKPKDRTKAVTHRNDATSSDSEDGDRTVRRVSPPPSLSPPLFSDLSDTGRSPLKRDGSAVSNSADEGLPSMDKFWADVTEGAEADPETDAGVLSLPPRDGSSATRAGLFEDEEDDKLPKPTKGKKPKVSLVEA